MTATILAEIRAAKQPYYVYILRKPDGTPFYVGFGKDRRIFEHEWQARKTKRMHPKLSVIRKVIRSGAEILYTVDSWHNDQESACAREVQLILNIGRRDLGTGSLTNLTSGGETPQYGPDSFKKMSAARKRWQRENPERYLAMQRHAAEAKRTDEFRTKASRAIKKFLADNPGKGEEMRRKSAAVLSTRAARKANSERTKAYYAAHPEARAAVAKRIRAYFRDPENRRKKSEQTKTWFRENARKVKKIRRKINATMRTPEARAARSEISRRAYARNPQLRAALSERQRKRFADPEMRRKMSETKKRQYAKNPELREKLSKAKLAYYARLKAGENKQ